MAQDIPGCDTLPCHQLTAAELLKELGSSESGLSSADAEERLAQYGPNEIREIKGRPLILKFLENFYHLFAIMLWVGGGLAFVAQMPQLGWAIFAVIFINAFFSFWQEYKAGKATDALKKMIPHKARVIRDGQTREILAAELVRGDLMVLVEGDAISADARLIEEFELRTNNATLTGESEPVRKTAAPHADESLTPIEMPNLVFAGTSVAYGGGKAVVYATAMDTQFGKIAELTQSVPSELSPLQKEMNKVTQTVAIIATGIGVSFFLLGYFFAGLELLPGFVFAIGIIVALVPEGLLPTVTLSLAMGVQRMAKRHALIKKLSSVETLGCTTVICTDKTGTLTKNEMTVRDIWVDGQHLEVSGGGYDPAGAFLDKGEALSSAQEKALEVLVRSAALCNNARLIEPASEEDAWAILGDPTEAALLVAARKAGFDLEAELAKSRRVFELPFDSVRKRMTTVHIDHKFGRIGYVKGAPREVLELCTHLASSDGVVELAQSLRDEIIEQNDAFARDGLRVLAMAYRTIAEEETDYSPEKTEHDLVFVGLMAMMDPPRDAVTVAVEECHTAGIRIIMITGDYGLTAESIARRIGIVKGDARIVTGNEINEMGEGQLKEALGAGDVLFARVSPEHKMLIAQALKDMGNVVAMTGDGVNDAPALKVADIGVAMGIAGTDVAKEAADMILTDDNFASIEAAVEEGRSVFDNLTKFILWILPTNGGVALILLVAIIAGITLPMLPTQLLWINLVTALFLGLTLVFEPKESDIMQRPPRDPKRPLLTRWLLIRTAMVTLISTAGAFGLFAWEHGIEGKNVEEARTAVVNVIIMVQTFYLLNCRSRTRSIFSIGLCSNPWLLAGIAATWLAQLAFTYLPLLNRLFHTAPVRAEAWLYIVGIGLFTFATVEFEKWIRFGGGRGQHAIPDQKSAT